MWYYLTSLLGFLASSICFSICHTSISATDWTTGKCILLCQWGWGKGTGTGIGPGGPGMSPCCCGISPGGPGGPGSGWPIT